MREEAAPAYLRGREGSDRALPAVELLAQEHGKICTDGEESVVKLECVVGWVIEDLFVELMEGLRYQ